MLNGIVKFLSIGTFSFPFHSLCFPPAKEIFLSFWIFFVLPHVSEQTWQVPVGGSRQASLVLCGFGGSLPSAALLSESLDQLLMARIRSQPTRKNKPKINKMNWN